VQVAFGADDGDGRRCRAHRLTRVTRLSHRDGAGARAERNGSSDAQHPEHQGSACNIGDLRQEGDHGAEHRKRVNDSPGAPNPRAAIVGDRALDEELRRERAHEHPLDEGEPTLDAMACPPAARCSSLAWRRASFLRYRPGWRRGRSLRIADSAILISAPDDAIVVLTGTFMPLTGIMRGFACADRGKSRRTRLG